MYAANILLFLAAGASASIIAERAPRGAVEARAILQGWSVQSSQCPTNSNSCGNGSCCPASLTCATAANDEVSACCTGGADCRGMIEGAPACADSSWNLYKGLNGNGFCCLPGMVGIYDYHNNVAGSCVASPAAGATLAVWQSTGIGAAATSAAAAPASTAAAGTVVAGTVAAGTAVASTAVAGTVAETGAASLPATVAATVVGSAGASGATAVTSAASGAATGVTGSDASGTATGAAATATKKSGAEKTRMGVAAVVVALVAMLAF